ncbi:hypothetical protein EJB05_56857, partial [Eragrostis curvula]
MDGCLAADEDENQDTRTCRHPTTAMTAISKGSGAAVRVAQQRCSGMPASTPLPSRTAAAVPVNFGNAPHAPPPQLPTSTKQNVPSPTSTKLPHKEQKPQNCRTNLLPFGSDGWAPPQSSVSKDRSMRQCMDVQLRRRRLVADAHQRQVLAARRLIPMRGGGSQMHGGNSWMHGGGGGDSSIFCGSAWCWLQRLELLQVN